MGRAIRLLLATCAIARAQTYNISTLAGGALPVKVPGPWAPLAPGYIAAGSHGNLFFGNQNVVLRMDAATGVVTLAAGNGTTGFSGDGGLATSARLNGAQGLAIDAIGNLYIADANNSRIRKVANGVITAVAGNGVGGFSAATTVRRSMRNSFRHPPSRPMPREISIFPTR